MLPAQIISASMALLREMPRTVRPRPLESIGKDFALQYVSTRRGLTSVVQAQWSRESGDHGAD